MRALGDVADIRRSPAVMNNQHSRALSRAALFQPLVIGDLISYRNSGKGGAAIADKVE
jgi:hypothetical protein